jgi:hypothetical protein
LLLGDVSNRPPQPNPTRPRQCCKRTRARRRAAALCVSGLLRRVCDVGLQKRWSLCRRADRLLQYPPMDAATLTPSALQNSPLCAAKLAPLRCETHPLSAAKHPSPLPPAPPLTDLLVLVCRGPYLCMYWYVTPPPSFPPFPPSRFMHARTAHAHARTRVLHHAGGLLLTLPPCSS